MDIRKVFSIMLACSTLMLGACGDDETPGPGAGSPAAPTATEEPAEPSPSQPTETGEVVSLQTWLVEGETLRPVLRSVPDTPAVARAAVEELLAGPSGDEATLGISSEVPQGVELLDIAVSDGVATVDVSSGFESGGGSATMRMRLAQLVYTVTQFQSVRGLQLRIDGRPVDTFSNEGIDVSEPQARKGYKDLLPPIVVLQPGIGAEATSPIEVVGTANVFEATVSMRLVVGGEEIASGFTTATCGTGCRGTYSGLLEFDVDGVTEATLEVFESSAEDGSPLHVVAVPLLLQP